MITGWVSGTCGTTELPDTPSDRLPWRKRWSTVGRSVMRPHWRVCPQPGCDLVASVQPGRWADSTDGPVQLVRSDCPVGHWFLGTYDTLFRP